MTSSSGSATGNPRNKVALKPGHSLMDWIRLGNSGKDLTGVGGAFLNVSKTELEQHNKRNDAWLSIRGKVYNVTSYMDFHPGGEEELMRGVGKDATNLFNQVHAWVNYESILQKCIVGRLGPVAAEENPFSIPSSSLTIPRTIEKTSALNNRAQQSTNSKPVQMDWFQQIGFLTLVFYTKFSCPQVHVSLQNGTRLCIALNNKVQYFNLEAGVSWPCSVTVDIAGKVQVKLNKRKPGLWRSYGTIEITESMSLPEYWPVTITSIVALTHDTKQIDLIYKENVFNHIPVGHHILVKVLVNGEEMIRPYTPVTGLGSTVPPCFVRLVIKSYDTGCVSSWLCSRHQGESLFISGAQGSFSPNMLSSKTHLVLLAAGTGITPMISLITWALRSSRLKVNLLFLNKTEKDIIWREQMERLMSDNCRFSVEHVLSEAGTEWIGKKGHINLPILQSLLPDSCKDIPCTHFVCICGPTLFTQITERYLKEDLKYSSDNIHCFLGS